MYFNILDIIYCIKVNHRVIIISLRQYIYQYRRVSGYISCTYYIPTRKGTGKFQLLSGTISHCATYNVTGLNNYHPGMDVCAWSINA